MTYLLHDDLVVSSLDVLEAATDGGDLVLCGGRLWIEGPVIVGAPVDPEEVERVKLLLVRCGNA